MGVVQIDATLFEIYLDLAVEFALPLRMFGARMDTFLGFSGKDRAIARGVLFADHILDPWGRDSRTLLVERLPVLAPGVTETFAHPVDDGPELRSYDPDHRDVRVADGLCFTDPAIAALLATTSVIPISYRPLRELQRARKVNRGS